MGWVSPKVYAILNNSEEGKDILEGLADKSQEEVDKEVAAFFGKGGKGEAQAVEKDIDARPNETKLMNMEIDEEKLQDMASRYLGEDKLKRLAEINDIEDIDDLSADELIRSMSDDEIADMMRLNDLDFDEDDNDLDEASDKIENLSKVSKCWVEDGKLKLYTNWNTSSKKSYDQYIDIKKQLKKMFGENVNVKYKKDDTRDDGAETAALLEVTF